MRRIVTGIGVLIPVVLLTANGCVATRNWVQETVGKRTTEIDQRVSTVDTERRQDAARIDQRIEQHGQKIDQQVQRVAGVEVSVREGSQRLEGVGRQVQGLEGSVSEVSETAKGARVRADEVDGRLTRLWENRNVRKLSDTVNVPFAFNRSDLGDAAQTSLVSLVRELQQNPKLLVELEGYSDPKGPRDYNVELSQRRVEAVRRYLVQNGIEVSRIHSIGLGPVTDPKLSDAAKRRVTVKLMVLAD
jgi:outer membrane protein OmpA-like peptidoglycan-associated protein